MGQVAVKLIERAGYFEENELIMAESGGLRHKIQTN